MKVTVKFLDWNKIQDNEGSFFRTSTPQIYKGTAQLFNDKSESLGNITCFLEGSSEFRIEGDLPEGITLAHIKNAFFNNVNSIYVIEIDDVVDAVVDVDVVDDVDVVVDAAAAAVVTPSTEQQNLIEESKEEVTQESANTPTRANELLKSVNELKKQYNIDMHLSSFSLGMGIGLICSLIGAVVLAFCSTEVGIALIAAGVLAVLVGFLMKNQEDTTHHKTPAPSM